MSFLNLHSDNFILFSASKAVGKLKIRLVDNILSEHLSIKHSVYNMIRLISVEPYHPISDTKHLLNK